jgi:uncharacterized protein
MSAHASIPPDGAAPLFRRFGTRSGEHLLVVPHSRIFDLPPHLAALLDTNDPQALLLVQALAQSAAGEEPLDSLAEPAPQSISLNVSSTCNLSCTYCYAERGAFHGAQTSTMTPAVAYAAIEQLFANADAARPVTVGFLGGEPFANRTLLHAIVAFAQGRGRALGLDVRFAVTTNATLLRPDDLALLRSHPFAVTVSVDGGAQVQNAQRPTRGGNGSFAALRNGIGALLAAPASRRAPP